MNKTEFISENELIELVKKSNTKAFDIDFLNLVSNPELTKVVNLAINKRVSKKMANSFFESACEDIVKRIKDFRTLYIIGLGFYSKELKEAYIHKILGKKQLQLSILKNSKGLRSKTKIDKFKTVMADIASLSEDRTFLRDCVINSKKYGIDGYEEELLYNHNSVYRDDFSVSNREIWKYIDDDYLTVDYNKPKEEDNNNLGPLDYTNSEIFSVEMYAGQTPGIGSLASSTIGFRTLNIMFFSGIDSELERIYDDGKELIPGALYQADELMDRALDLFSIMYKYGKRMNSDAKVYRVDRASTTARIYKEKRSVSYLSTSKTGYKQFPKKDIALIEATIKKGTPCVDFSDVLGENYNFFKEAEILVAPNCKVTSGKPREPKSEHELEVENNSHGRASAVYNMEITSPDIPQSLSEDELADLARKNSIYYNKKMRDKAARFISKLQSLKQIRQEKEEVLEIIDADDVNSYLEWKKAFQDVYGYRTRQIMLQIDKEVSEALKDNRPLYSESTEDLEVIPIQEKKMGGPNIKISEITIPPEQIEAFIKGYLKDNILDNSSNIAEIKELINNILPKDDKERRGDLNF